MRSIKGSLVGLVLAGILALAPTAAVAHGGGGGGHGGGGAISVVAAAISPDLRGIASPAIASPNTKERTLPDTKINSGTEIVSFLEIPLGMITHTMGLIIRTTAIIMTMLATIPMDNPRQPK